MAKIDIDKIYSELVCEDVPIRADDDSIVDPWDGVKPHAEDRFYAKYCKEYYR